MGRGDDFYSIDLDERTVQDLMDNLDADLETDSGELLSDEDLTFLKK